MADIDQQRARQDYERGQLAVDVYRPKNERGVEGWDIKRPGDDETGLKAQVYESRESGEIVIAFGGTDPGPWGQFWKDLQADVGFLSSYLPLPEQIKAGLDFCAQVIDAEIKSRGVSNEEDIEKVLDDISLAGHSLGGGIAQLAGYVFGLSGTTMDAPGVEYICNNDGFNGYVQDLRARYPHLVQEELGEGKEGDFRCFTEDGSGVSWAGGDHHGKEIEMDNVADLPPWLMTAVMVMTGGTIEAARVLALWIAGDNAFSDQHEKETMLKALAERCGCDTDAIEAPDDEAASDDGDSAPIHGEYIWQPGDELEALAQNINGVKAADIADYNGLDAGADLAPDDVIYVPDFVELQQFRADESAEGLAEDMQVLMVEAKVFFQHQLSLLSTELEELREQLNGEDLTAELKEQMQQQMEELKQLYQDAVEQLQDKISKYLDDLQELPERLQQELSDFKDQLLEYKEQFANLDETWSEALDDLSAALDDGIEWDALMYYALDELGKEIDIPLSVDFGLDSEGGDILNQVVSTELHNIAESGWESMVEGTEFSYDLNMMELGTMAAAAIGGYYGTQDGMSFYEGWSGNAIDTREEAAGAMIGGALGAKIGAGIGTAALPIVGTAVGAYVGSFIGSAAGAFLGSFLGDEPPVPSANARYVYDAESGEYKLESSGANETGSVEAVRQIGEALGTGVVAISTMSGSQVAGAYPDIVVFQSGDKWMMNGIVSSDPTTAIERAMIEISQGIEYEGGSDYIRRAFYESDAANVVDLQADLAYATNYQRYQQGGAPVFLVNSDFAETEDGERAELLAGDALSSAQTKLYIAYNQLLGESSVNSEDAEQVADALRQSLELADDSSYGDVVAALRENLIAQLQEQMGQLPAEERQAAQAEIDALVALADAEAMAAWAAEVESVSFREYVDMKIDAGEGADYQQMIDRATSMGVDQEHYSDYFSKLGRLAESAGVRLNRCTMDDLSFRLDGDVLTIKVATSGGSKEFVLDFGADGDFDWLTSRMPLGNNMYSLAGIVQTLQLEDGQELSGKDYLDAAFAGIAADADGERIAMTAGDDNYTGSGYRDLIIGGGGNDIINSGGGDDYIDASGGSDVIDAGEGTDTVSYANAKGGVSVNLHQGLAAETDGAAGAEGAQIQTLDKLVNVENVVGSAYGDSLVGDAGANELDGAAGDDFIRAGAGDDVLIGGAGDDQLFGETGNDELRGGSGDDVLLGGEGDDVLQGGSGDDRLLGGVGADVIDGGLGDDTISYSDSSAGIEMVLDKGDGEGFGLGGEAEGDSLISVENVDGSAFADVIAGSSEANQLRAGGGDDTVSGASGDDILQGEDGDDKLFGDWGDDSLFGGDNDDLLFGGQGNDHIYGHVGNDVLDGGDGDDFFHAGLGDDRVYGGAGFDTLALDGKLADYDFFSWRDEGLLIQDKANEEIDLVTGLEAFEFADRHLSLAELEQQLQDLKDIDDSRDAEIDAYGNPGSANNTVYRAAQISAVAMAAVYAGILSAHTNDGTTGEVGYFSDENTGEINPLLLEAVQENWGLEVDLPEANAIRDDIGTNVASSEQSGNDIESSYTVGVTELEANGALPGAEAVVQETNGNYYRADDGEANSSNADRGNSSNDAYQLAVEASAVDAFEEPDEILATVDDDSDTQEQQQPADALEDAANTSIEQSDDDSFNAPSVNVAPSTVAEDGEVALSVQVQPGNPASDINIYLTIPPGASLNHGSLQADGRWKLELNDLHDLRLSPGRNDGADFVVGVEVLEFSAGSLSRISSDSIAVEVNAVADAPELAVTAAIGAEDSAIALDIASNLVDIDGSEILRVYLEGIPDTASLSSGVKLADGRWLLSSDELPGLQLNPGHNSSNDFTLTVRALSSESENGSSAETVLELPVTVNAVADAPELKVVPAAGTEDNAIRLNIASSLVDADGSESLRVYLEGVPADVMLSAGVRLGDGRWLLRPDELADLKLTPGINSGDDFILTVRALSSEDENASIAETVLELPVRVNAVADAPDLSAEAVHGKEDIAIALDISSKLNDIDGSEKLTIFIEQMPEGAELNKGTDIGNGIWKLDPADLNDLTITPPHNSDVDFVLKVTAATTEYENGNNYFTSRQFSVAVDPVADVPVITKLTIGDNYSDDMIDGVLSGSSAADLLYGGGGDDKIYGHGGDDKIYGDTSNRPTQTPIIMSFAVSDTDGSERIASYIIRGVPIDSHLSMGQLIESTDTVSSWQIILPGDADKDKYIAGLELISPPANSHRSIELSVSAIAIDGDSLMESSQSTINIEIEAEIDGKDSIFGGIGNDWLYGENGNDKLYGEAGNDWLFGSVGNDSLQGGDGNDELYGGDGSDTLYGNSGTDSYYAGSGNDTLYLDANDIKGANVIDMSHEDFGGGTGYDTAHITGYYRLFSLDDWQVERVIEGDGNYSSTLTAQGKNESVYIDAGNGNDTVIGGNGGDTLRGGAGRDIIEGGEGNDTIYADILDTRISGGNGFDKVIFEQTDSNYNRGINYFNIADAEVESVHGTDMADNFYSRSSYTTNTRVYAGGGDDRVASGKGNDFLDGGSGTDSLDISHATGATTVNLQTGTLRGALGTDSVRNFENVIGSRYSDTITGSSRSNNVVAGAGNDVLDGGRGDDTLVLAGSVRNFYNYNKNNSDLWQDIANDNTNKWLSFRSPDGSTKRIKGFEHIKFSDYELHLDGSNNDVVQVSDGSRLSASEDQIAYYSTSTFIDRFFDFDGDRLSFSAAKGDNSRYIDKLYSSSSRVEYRADDDLNTTGNSWDKGLISSDKASFLYKVSDGKGGDSDWLTQEVKVDAVNDAPIVTGISSLGNNKYRLKVNDIDSVSFSNSSGNASSYYAAGDSSINMREGHDTPDYMANLGNLDFVYRAGVNRWEKCNWRGCKTKSETAYRDFDITVKDDHGASDKVRFNGRYKSIRAAPIALDLDDNGNIAYISESSSGQSWFDLNDDGVGDLSAWVAPEDGFLAIDIDGNGVIEHREELVLAAWGELAIAEQDLRMDFNGDGVVDLVDFDADGNGVLSDLEGLRYFDSNQDGVINSDDEAWEQFGVWQDADSDGISDAGEFRDLDSEGITSVDLSSDGEERSEADGDAIIYGEGSYTRSDGSTGISHDAALSFADSDPDAEPSQSAEAGYSDAAEVYADEALDYSEAQIAADLALLRSGTVDAELANSKLCCPEAMEQIAEQARAMVADNAEMPEHSANIAAKVEVEPELAKACVIAAGYLAAASVNTEGADNLPANSDDTSANLDLSEPDSLFGF